MRRVVITGTGFCSPIGSNAKELLHNLENLKSGIVYMNQWDGVKGLEARVAGLVDIDDFSQIPRANRRTMDRVAMMCALSLQDAIKQSGIDQDILSSPRTGISFGSAMGG